MKKNLLENFNQPPASYRTAPFWAWNSKLNPNELKRQIGIFKEMGFGGFFMHSRTGLETPYLQEEFFDCVQSCIDEANKLNLDVWLYDEDRWPSGSAGGLVSKNDKFRMRAIYLEKANSVNTDELSQKIMAYYAIKLTDDADKIKSYRFLGDNSTATLADDETLFCGYWQYNYKRSWFNDESYIDTMNSDAVTEFLQVTHEKYCQHIGENFGKKVKGIFTDEPGFSVWENDYGVPYTENLIEIFNQRYNYNFLEFLPELFFNYNNEFSKVRYDFTKLITEMFVNAFSKQIGKWCDKNNLAFTGHIFNEDTLSLQYCFNGASMRFYEYMTCPGVDVLTERWNLFIAIKQCVSVAEQLGKNIRTCELYACTGWDFPLTGHKASVDWQFALGINFFVPHIAWYTMAGEAKRDYPASISFQSPWYKKYRIITDYTARLRVLTENLKGSKKILFIHEIESFWGSVARNEAFKKGNNLKLHEKEVDFIKISHELLANHLDYDYGDEELISRYGKVIDGTCQVGMAKYQAILIPDLVVIRNSTLEFLEKFADQGGGIYYFGDVPKYLDGDKSDLPQTIYRKFKQLTMDNYISELSVLREVSVCDKSGIEVKPLLSRFAQTDDYATLFISNFGCEFSENIFAEKRIAERNLCFDDIKIEVNHEFIGDIYQVDAITGKIWKIDYNYLDNKYQIKCSFDVREAKLFIFSKEDISNSVGENITHKLESVEKKFLDTFEYQLDDYNCLILDHADLLIDDNIVKQNTYILHIDDFLREKIGVPMRNESMVQPYCREYSQKVKDNAINFELQYNFECEIIPQNNIMLALETPEVFELKLNGKILEKKIYSYWIDPAIKCIEIPIDLIQKDTNFLQVKGIYNYQQNGLEALYILGDFGVNEDKLTTLPNNLKSQNICDTIQGI